MIMLLGLFVSAYARARPQCSYLLLLFREIINYSVQTLKPIKYPPRETHHTIIIIFYIKSKTHSWFAYRPNALMRCRWTLGEWRMSSSRKPPNGSTRFSRTVFPENSYPIPFKYSLVAMLSKATGESHNNPYNRCSRTTMLKLTHTLHYNNIIRRNNKLIYMRALNCTSIS